MKKLLVVLMLLVFSSLVFAEDAIYLKSGKILKGKITEEGGDSISIEIKDEWKEVNRKDIKKIVRDKEEKEVKPKVKKGAEETPAGVVSAPLNSVFFQYAILVNQGYAAATPFSENYEPGIASTWISGPPYFDGATAYGLTYERKIISSSKKEAFVFGLDLMRHSAYLEHADEGETAETLSTYGFGTLGPFDGGLSYRMHSTSIRIPLKYVYYYIGSATENKFAVSLSGGLAPGIWFWKQSWEDLKGGGTEHASTTGTSFLLFAVVFGFDVSIPAGKSALLFRFAIDTGAPGVSPSYTDFFGTGENYQDSDYDFVGGKARALLSSGLSF